MNLNLYLSKEYYTIGEFKQILDKQLCIPVHRQRLLFYGKEITDDNQIINDIKCDKFSLDFTKTPKESDYVDIEVIDCTRNADKKENFELKVDLYGDIHEQIANLDKFRYSRFYLIYEDKFINYKYAMFIDNYFGKKIKVELFQIYNDNMEVFIRPLTGDTLDLYVDPLEHVGYLKIRIFDKNGIPPDQQRLVYKGKQLDDNKTLDFYNIEKYSSIHLTLRLRGGK